MASLYILRSLKNERFYIGSTNDLERRLDEHNSGLSKYTKANRPFKLVFFQEFKDLSQARATEAKLKRFKSSDIIHKIIRDGRITSVWE